MKPEKYTPVKNLISLPDGIERFFESMGLDLRHSDTVWCPSVDISETEEAYELQADLPGMKKENITISYKDQVLSLSGEKSQEEEKKEKNYHRIERSFGRFERSFRLPSEIKPEEIKASFKDGVLSVRVPKTEEAKPKEISIGD